ncbi:hypothetical protein ATL39_0921 [Sinobaca qinghaiensis]|uniref:DUF1643 domain-containing protein n=1 Tax=Sinobaca qinghaiensis TaxID=342944 RepID=A0A419V5F9_9BACL|nr:DUF1643 domain-containing protein [Sinobaca qinghaiensis]RKD75223.1 hypothetical protein ATL39_0921 [Sinobaca qinghaiensis]
MAGTPWKSDEKVTVIFDNENQNDRTYRYSLKCIWDDQKDIVTFIMLNPSVADADLCDPTLKRCMNFSKSWGYGGMNILNLYALISTNPKGLKLHNDPIGPENDKHLFEALKNTDKIVLACGQSYKGVKNRITNIMSLINDQEIYCIDTTVKNIPKHPLYLKGNSVLKPYTI